MAVVASVENSDLKRFIGAPVKVCIHGEAGEDMAPWLDKKVKKLANCPDNTHLRIFFDDHYFFAVPLTSEVEQTETEWSAYDPEAGLHYVIKSEGKPL